MSLEPGGRPQRPPNNRVLLRYFRIFGTPQFDPILKASIGISAVELYTLGLAFTGHFLNEFGFGLPERIEFPEITPEGFARFVDHFSTSMDSLRQQAKEQQSYDQDYAYTFNPLRRYPLIQVISDGKRGLIAPIPTFLFWRFTEGVYYEICDAAGFSDVFGSSFQNYVGDVLAAINKPVSFLILAEQDYHVGKNRKDSVDWIVS